MDNLPQIIKTPQSQYVTLRVGHKHVSDHSSLLLLKKELSEILEISYFDMGSGSKMDPMIIVAQTESLFKELSGKYGTLTLPEVKEAFRRGIRGESGPFFGLCAKTYHQFLKWYFELPDRAESWRGYLLDCSKAENSEKKVVLERDVLVKACTDAFSDFKTNGKMPFIPHAIYNTIVELRGVKTLISTEDWKDVRSDGIALYKKRQVDGLTEKKANLKIASLIIQMSDPSVENCIKEAGLRNYFRNLIKDGKDLVL